jgi:hypothetical protein
VLSHPCDKNKYVARMGHPASVVSERKKAKARLGCDELYE